MSRENLARRVHGVKGQVEEERAGFVLLDEAYRYEFAGSSHGLALALLTA